MARVAAFWWAIFLIISCGVVGVAKAAPINERAASVANRCEGAMSIADLDSHIVSLQKSGQEQSLELAHCHVALAQAHVRALHANGYVHNHFIEDELPLILYERAGKIYRTHPPGRAWALMLADLGHLYALQAQWTDAIRALARRVWIYNEIADATAQEQVQAISDLAEVNLQVGLLQLAKVHAQTALALCDKYRLGMGDCKAVGLSIFGDVFAAVGDYASAVPQYEQVLQGLKSELGENHLRTLEVDVKLRLAHNRLGRASDVQTIAFLQYYIATLTRAGQGRSLAMAGVLEHLALLQSKNQLANDALVSIGQALALREQLLGLYAPSLAATLNSQAKILLANNQVDSMRQPLTRSMALGWRLGTFSVKAELFDLWAEYEKRLNNLPAAIFFSKRAAEMTLQSGREIGLASLGLGRHLVAIRSGIFRRLVVNLLDANRLVEARDALDLLKENEFLDFTERVPEVTRRAEHTEYEWPFKDKMYLLACALCEVQAEKEKIRRSAVLPTRDALLAMYAKLGTDEGLYAKLLQEIEFTFQQDAAKQQLAYVKVRDAVAAKSTLLAQLGHGAVMLQYLVAEENVYILLTTHQGLTLHKTRVPNLNQQVDQFFAMVQNPGRDPLPMAKQLYQQLFAPVENDLRAAQAKILMFAWDGRLHRIPIGALHDGKQYLVQRFDFALLTKPDLSALSTVPEKNIRVGAMGVTRAIGGFRALPGVLQEVNGIVKSHSGDAQALLPGEKVMDDAFTANALQTLLAKKYPVLHIASHFVMQNGDDKPSFLLLGDGSQLDLAQLKENRFDFSQTDLLTLSACDTAVGAENANGLAVEGMGVILQNRGAKSILATKWAIEDQSTALLMKRFYRHWSRGSTKAMALRLAQSSFIDGANDKIDRGQNVRGIKRLQMDESGNFKTDRRRPWAHPYYWAAFVLMGNWL